MALKLLKKIIVASSERESNGSSVVFVLGAFDNSVSGSMGLLIWDEHTSVARAGPIALLLERERIISAIDHH